MKAFGIGLLIGAAIAVINGDDATLIWFLTVVGIGFVIAGSSGGSKHKN